MSVLLIDPENVRSINMFVEASSIKPSKDFDDEELFNEDQGGPHQENGTDLTSVQSDLQNSFIIVRDGTTEGHAVAHAKFSQQQTKVYFRECAVRESGTSKVSKVIRFS